MVWAPSRDIVWVEATPVVSATPDYDAADLVGTKIEFQHVGKRLGTEGQAFGAGLIQHVLITDLASQAADLDVLFFDSDPDGTTFTDNAALDIADADLVRMIGFASITDWSSFADNAIGQALNLAMPFVLPESTSLFAAIIARGSGINLASTSDITVRVGILAG